MSSVASARRPKEERPARFHRPLNDVAGLVLLLLLGAALGFELGRNPVPPLYVAAGCFGIVFVLALAIFRYDWAVALGILLMPVVRAEPAPVDARAGDRDGGRGRHQPARAAARAALDAHAVALFIALNLLSCMEAMESNIAAKYLAVTTYCLFIGIWICGYVDRERRARLVIKSYIISAVAIAVASSIALYVTLPGLHDPAQRRLRARPRPVQGRQRLRALPGPGGADPRQESLQPRLLQAQPADPDLLLRLPRRRHPVLVLARRVAEPGRRRSSS